MENLEKENLEKEGISVSTNPPSEEKLETTEKVDVAPEKVEGDAAKENVVVDDSQYDYNNRPKAV